MEEQIFFESEGLKLEGRLNRQPGGRAAVITHPHPLYGGDMHNPVVKTAARVYDQKGCSTLRFNFRGVGSSLGTYSDGPGERQDVRAALSFMAAMGKTDIDLAGYSFGAWINAHLDPPATDCGRMLMISPPVAFMDFSAVAALPRLVLVVSGGRDEIGPPDMIRQYLPAWNPEAHFEIIPGADHFYSGALDALAAVLGKTL